MNYVEAEQTREEFKQEALESWSHYLETGLHLSLKETEGWLSTWGDNSNKVKKVPKCHK